MVDVGRAGDIDLLMRAPSASNCCENGAGALLLRAGRGLRGIANGDDATLGTLVVVVEGRSSMSMAVESGAVEGAVGPYIVQPP